MTMCNAFVTKYVGKGPERTTHAGHCLMEAGHDGEHLPPSLLNSGSVSVMKAELDRAKVLAAEIASQLELEGASDHAVNELTALLGKWSS
jgi:hypothetical protein